MRIQKKDDKDFIAINAMNNAWVEQVRRNKSRCSKKLSRISANRGTDEQQVLFIPSYVKSLDRLTAFRLNFLWLMYKNKETAIDDKLLLRINEALQEANLLTIAALKGHSTLIILLTYELFTKHVKYDIIDNAIVYYIQYIASHESDLIQTINISVKRGGISQAGKEIINEVLQLGVDILEARQKITEAMVKLGNLDNIDTSIINEYLSLYAFHIKPTIIEDLYERLSIYNLSLLVFYRRIS